MPLPPTTPADELPTAQPVEAGTTAAANVDEDGRPIDPTEEFRRPPDEDFWEKYSGRLEFPLSWTAAILFHVCAALTFFGMWTLANMGDRDPVPMRVVEVGGDDDEGAGSPGSGGELEPIQGEDNLAEALKDFEKLDLPPVKDDQPVLPDDPAAAVQQKLKETNAKRAKREQGSGPGEGRGDTGQAGKGPGGDGNDMTRKRGINWSLRFRFDDSKVYLQQLAAAKAVILIPSPTDPKKFTIIPDLDNYTIQREATPEDMRRVGPLLKFFEHDRQSGKGLLRYLNVAGDPTAFYICFPREFEEQLAMKEKSYRNRRPEDIKQTIFQFSVRDGKIDVVVSDQKLK